MVGQHGPVWYLGGIFKVVEPPESAATEPASDPEGITPTVISRECRVPLGKEILLPVLNVECNSAEEIALGNLDPDATTEEKIGYLRDECAQAIADEITEYRGHFGPDGGLPRELRVKRLANGKPFAVTFSPDNVLPLEVDFSNPSPNPSLTFADGYWVKVKPKDPGRYVLETYGVAEAFDFALKITYKIEVVEEGPGAIFD
jgi:hypothetical protein